MGQGVLQYATYEMDQLLTLDAKQLFAERPQTVLSIFRALSERCILPIEEELEMDDRLALDNLIFDMLGLTPKEREAVYEAIVGLVEGRLKKARSLR